MNWVPTNGGGPALCAAYATVEMVVRSLVMPLGFKVQNYTRIESAYSRSVGRVKVQVGWHWFLFRPGGACTAHLDYCPQLDDWRFSGERWYRLHPMRRPCFETLVVRRDLRLCVTEGEAAYREFVRAEIEPFQVARVLDRLEPSHNHLRREGEWWDIDEYLIKRGINSPRDFFMDPT